MAVPVPYERNPDDGLFYEKKNENMYTEKEQQIVKKLHKNLTEEGEVMYPGRDTPGSPLRLLLKWYFSEDRTKNKPIDADLFLELIEKNNRIIFPKKWKKLYDSK